MPGLINNYFYIQAIRNSSHGWKTRNSYSGTLLAGHVLCEAFRRIAEDLKRCAWVLGRLRVRVSLGSGTKYLRTHRLTSLLCSQCPGKLQWDN